MLATFHSSVKGIYIMTTKKVVVANYSEDVLQAIVAEYNAFIVDYPQDNMAILNTLATKYGKSVHSLRAKLASLKVYKTIAGNANSTCNSKMTKESLANAIAAIVGRDLVGLEVAPKATLQTLYDFVRTQARKIEQLASDLASE